VPSSPPGPGLAKVKGQPILTTRVARLLAVRDGWWARALQRADIISEGSVVEERSHAPAPAAPCRPRQRFVYYGTTSLRCHLEPAAQGWGSELSAARLAAVVLSDPHARLRVLRIAHREAAARAPGTLGVLHAEMSSRSIGAEDSPIIAIDIDVSAEITSPARDATGD